MKTIEQVLADERAAREEFEQREKYRGFTIASLRKVFESIQNKDGWKLPWAAAVPHQCVEAVLVAVEFYHADKAKIIGVEPITGKVLMEGNGYQAY